MNFYTFDLSCKEDMVKILFVFSDKEDVVMILEVAPSLVMNYSIVDSLMGWFLSC